MNKPRLIAAEVIPTIHCVTGQCNDSIPYAVPTFFPSHTMLTPGKRQGGTHPRAKPRHTIGTYGDRSGAQAHSACERVQNRLQNTIAVLRWPYLSARTPVTGPRAI